LATARLDRGVVPAIYKRRTYFDGLARRDSSLTTVEGLVCFVMGFPFGIS
jgi:hypothetical protein